ncbi:putative Zn-dependent hydrolase of the beta-lactamase fold-like protein [Janthinobacterium sp. HH01]|uniref:MBL fold metallo-hydrolase n=1 Tax=Janthinobacterium sp. HH01 TaxID=1198452 RepID=UPI0002AEBD33|nr:MBL fold metallo-hydrolase [Janthinobacterium sp. HH01]ELX11900.1 putative Zn-dependent hydrolase of the beta-lactamase fold-like protein [Janthinobacterium sp. HH01]
MTYQSVTAESALDGLSVPSAPRTRDGKFRNPVKMHQMGFFKSLGVMLRFAFDKPKDTVPRQAIPVHAITQQQLLDAPDRSLFRLGHSTVLLKLNGHFWLTDPVFSERASPVQWAGPQRFHQTPISIEELPPIKGIILSHDHYDHLDYAAVMKLAAKTEHFITPLGVGDRLIAWGIPAAKVQQLSWWQSTHVAGLKLVATPAQHFSGRGLSDRNKTLWASFVIEDRDVKVFFSGDSGYFDGFKEIGRKYGPFDLTMVETGAYDPQWPDVHMQPEESLQAHIDLRGKVMLPIHNGTFDLSLHAWHDPFDRIADLAAERRLPLATPEIGQALDIRLPLADGKWWELVKEQEAAMVAQPL